MTLGILLAAGKGERFGADKLSLELDGVPVWLRSFHALAHHPRIDQVGVVASAALQPTVRQFAPDAAFVVAGGETRQQSARLGLAAADPRATVVLFHDAARPYLSDAVIDRVLDGIAEAGAAFPCLPVTDTIKEIQDRRPRTLDRSRLVAVQTPQGARRELFERAHAATEAELTDDVALLEAIGINALPVEGDPANRKITRPEDLPRPILVGLETRTGLGYDIHPFSENPDRALWLGGVLFEGEGSGLLGHSDADAALHAAVDALLGAAGLGDIGDHYPNTDPRWKNAPSHIFLKEAAAKVRGLGWTLVHLDLAIVAERPKIKPKRDAMRLRIAEVLGVSPDRVSVKATTNERLGAIGRQEGVAAFAVATLQRPLN